MSRWIIYASEFILALIAAVALAALLSMLLFGCAIPAKSAEHPHPVRETITKFVACMSAPPPVEDLEWPTPDRIGNFIMHQSTAERFRAAYAALVRYTREQYYRCLHAADEAGTTSVTVEEDDAGVAP